MYVVMTTAELFQYTGYWRGFDGREESGVEDTLGWDFRELETENTGISQSELDQFEICLPSRIARRMGILAPRGEFWIKRAVDGGACLECGYWTASPVPQAIAPDRPLPSKGEPVQLRLVPIPGDQDDSPCSSCGYMGPEE